jgi:hypothetical protein
MSPRPPKPPREVAQEFVEGSGFPLEVRTADAFRQAGFTTFSSMVYDDPITGDVGEIDLIAYDVAAFGGEANFQLTYVVECKSSARIPWLLFRNPSGGATAPPVVRRNSLLTSHGTEALLRGHAPSWHERLRLTSELQGVAYRVRDAKENLDVPYKAVSGAIRAARAQIASTEQEYVLAKDNRLSISFEIVRPVVVVGAPLFFCDFGPTGQFTLTETERGTVLATSHTRAHPRSVLVDVVAHVGLPAFLAEQRAVATELLSAMETPLKQAAAAAALEYERIDRRGIDHSPS